MNDNVEQTGGESPVANMEPKFPMNDCAKACAGVKDKIEVEAMNEVKETERKSAYDGFMERWPILFQQRRLPMSRTCMCWGIEAGDGWKQPLQKLCNQLEAINLMMGKKFGFEIQAVQVKQKFGELRFYFNVYQTVSLIRRFFGGPFIWLGRPDFEAEGLQKKVGDAISNFFYAIGSWIYYGGERRQRRYEAISSAIFEYVEDLISACEDECYKVCEKCGSTIGTDWSPRCETMGWISYICENCAKKGRAVYAKHLADGSVRYFNGETDVTEEYAAKKSIQKR